MDINAVTRNVDAIEQVRHSSIHPAAKQDSAPEMKEVKQAAPAIENGSDNSADVRESVERSIKAFEELAGRFNTALDLSIDQDSDEIIVKVVNKNTDKVIREIPSEEFLEFSERMHDFLGVLFDETA
jgi:flagellar protein FlaG